MKIKDGIHLYRGDCLEVMKKIPDNSVDCMFADLPYNQNSKYSWDKLIDSALMWEQLTRIVKDDGAMLFTSQQPFTSDLVSSNRSMFRAEWIWDKHIARGMHQAKQQPMRKHESVLVFSKSKSYNYYPIMVERDKPIRRKNYENSDGQGKFKEDQTDKWFVYTHKNPVSILTGFWETNRGKLHPTQKPLSLLKYLLETYSMEGDMIMDICFGSNTTGIAALEMNRRYIGIEKDEKYFNIGKDRISRD